jgi:two-component system, NtrC family, response regulator AtoC
MEPYKIFIVEDNVWYADILEYQLALNPDYEVTKFTTGKECLKNLYKHPSVITLDYSLPDISGREVLAEIKKYNVDIPVVIISGQEDIKTAVKLLKEGAYDYIVKDKDTIERIWNAINNIRETQKLRCEISSLKEEVRKKYEFSNIIKGNSPPIKAVFNLIEKAATTNITVSITGETGTGKELVAKAIHYHSPKRNEPFIAVNVSAIPKELVESEMFGYEKGAFTGANGRKTGRFEDAGRGTIFLDEIGEMDLNMQSKLLRAIQEKEFTRVGGNKLQKMEARVIVATHRNLAEEVENNRFRADLYYRLLGLPIELPPLRDRGNDIILLAAFFAEQFCIDNNIEKKKITAEAQKKLLSYNYPGNVRELKATMELSVVMSNSDTLTDTDINFVSATNGSGKNFLTEERTMCEYERMIVEYFLNKYNNNVRLVAQKLDIGKSKIYMMLKHQIVEKN